MSALVRVVVDSFVIAAAAFLSALPAAPVVAGGAISTGTPVPVDDFGAKSPPMLPLICAEGDWIKAASRYRDRGG